MKRGKSNMFQLSFLSRNARKIFLYSHSFWLHNCCIPGYFRVTKKNELRGLCLFTSLQLPQLLLKSESWTNSLLLHTTSCYQIIKPTQLPFFSTLGCKYFLSHNSLPWRDAWCVLGASSLHLVSVAWVSTGAEADSDWQYLIDDTRLSTQKLLDGNYFNEWFE